MMELHDTELPTRQTYPCILWAIVKAPTVEVGERMAENELLTLARQIVEEIWNQGELDEADRLFSPDYINHGGLIPDLVRGPEAVKLSVTVYRLAFPRLHITVEAFVAAEESVAFRWSARSAPVSGRGSPTDSSARDLLEGVTFGRFADRQVVESWTYWDREMALRQPRSG
jgi:hypothetical protein